MSTLKFDPFEEFQQFLAEISFKELVKNPDYSANSKRIHKRILALFVVEFQFQIELQKTSSNFTKITTTYLQEFRSDILSSMMIFHIGLYKATLISVRSAVENLFRVITGTQEIDFMNLKSVFDLVDLVKKSPSYKTNKLFKSSADLAIQKYGDLCNYVHSSTNEYLTLDRQLSDLPRWEKLTGTACADTLLKLIQAAICMLLILKPQTLYSLRHDQRDIVLDALPMRMKAELAQGI